MILIFPLLFPYIGDKAIKTYASETIIYNLKGSFFQKFSDNIRPLKNKNKKQKTARTLLQNYVTKPPGYQG